MAGGGGGDRPTERGQPHVLGQSDFMWSFISIQRILL